MRKKRIFSPEAIENIRKAAAKRKGILKGPRSVEDKEKIRRATIGKPKTIIEPNPTWFSKGHKPLSPFSKGNIPWNKGMKMSAEHIEKTASKIRGRKCSPETIEKRRIGMLNSGNKFRGGEWRSSFRGKNWINAVKERDGYKCVKCLIVPSSSKNLHAHHIVPWKVDESLRFDISNGITLCAKCHYLEECNNFPSNLSRKGANVSDETRKKMSDSRKGKTPWNKDKKITVLSSVGNITVN